MNKRISLIAILFLVLTHIVSLNGEPAVAFIPLTLPAGLNSEWVVEGDGFAVYDIAADGNHLYLVGTDSSSNQWRIEKRFLSSGGLVPTFGNNGVILSNYSAYGNAAAYGIAVDSEFMYIVGSKFYQGYPHSYPGGTIEKRRLSDGSLVWKKSATPGTAIYYDVALDSLFVYVVGARRSTHSGSFEWALIEKRNLSDGELVWTVEDQWTTGYKPMNILVSLAVDNEYIYAVGATGFGSWLKQYMVKRLVNTGAPDLNFKLNGHWGEGSGEYTDVVIDEDYMYIVGYENRGSGDWEWIVDKRDKFDGDYVLWSDNPWIYGRIVSNPSSGYDVAQALAKEGDAFYIVGYDCNTTQGDSQWRIEKRKLPNGALDTAFGEGGVITVNPRPGQAESPFAIVKKGNHIYVGGTPSWRVQSFLVGYLVYLPLIIRGQ